jgi:hypothetical protein
VGWVGRSCEYQEEFECACARRLVELLLKEREDGQSNKQTCTRVGRVQGCI